MREGGVTSVALPTTPSEGVRADLRRVGVHFESPRQDELFHQRRCLVIVTARRAARCDIHSERAPSLTRPYIDETSSRSGRTSSEGSSGSARRQDRRSASGGDRATGPDHRVALTVVGAVSCRGATDEEFLELIPVTSNPFANEDEITVAVRGRSIRRGACTRARPGEVAATHSGERGSVIVAGEDTQRDRCGAAQGRGRRHTGGAERYVRVRVASTDSPRKVSRRLGQMAFSRGGPR